MAFIVKPVDRYVQSDTLSSIIDVSKICLTGSLSVCVIPALLICLGLLWSVRGDTETFQLH